MFVPSTSLRYIEINLNYFFFKFLTILKKFRLVLQFIYKSSQFKPIWHFFIKLLMSYHRKTLYCLITILIKIETCMVHVKDPLWGSNILNLLFKIRDTFLAHLVALVIHFGMLVVTRDHQNFYARVIVIFVFTKKYKLLVFIPVNAKQTSLCICS